MELNDGQSFVVTAAGDRPIRVVAGAGTGKTRVLVERYLRFVRDGVPPERILALTFTLKAADEMRRRVFESAAEDDPGLLRQLYTAWIMNFHSFGYRIIRENAPALGIDPGVEVATDADLRRIDRTMEARFLAGRIDGVPADFGGVLPAPTRLSSLFDLYLRVVKKCRGDLIPVDELVEACTPEDPEPYVANVRAIAAVWDEYAAEMEGQGLIDFSDMIARAARGLAGDKRLGDFYRKKFDHILVDEFQDTSAAQYRLLEVLSGGSFANVTVVGDEKQSIYRWRDARVENIRDFPGMKLGLNVNYRSRQNILDLAHAFISADDTFGSEPDEMRLTADRPDGPNPIMLFHPGECERPTQCNDAEAAAVAAWVVHLTGGPLLSGAPPLVGGDTGARALSYGDVAVLLRAIREARVLPAIERAFQQAGIPYAVLGGADASGSRSLELFGAYLWLLLPGDRRRELLQVLESPPFAIGHASMIELIGDGGNEPGDARVFLSEDRIARVKDADARDRLRELRGLLGELHRDRARGDFRSFLLGALEDTPFFLRMFAGGGTVRAADDLVGELMDICGTLEQRANLGLWSFLEHLRVALDERSFQKDADVTTPPNRVRIMTIHQAKGLEFPAVAVAGIKQPRPDSEGFFVSKEKGVFSSRWDEWGRGYRGLDEREHEVKMKKQEERCLLYVAMTRAKDFLFVGSPYAGGVEKRGKSLFADVLGCAGEGRFGTIVVRNVPAVPRAVLPVEVAPPAGEGGVDRLLDRWLTVRASLSRQESLPEVTAAPIRFVNWSALAAFAACPLQYRYRHVLKLEDAEAGGETPAVSPAGEKGDVPDPDLVPDEIPAAKYGIVVHELLRQWMAFRADGATPPDGWIETSLERLGLALGSVSKVAERARRLVEVFAGSDLSRPGDEMRLEEPFQIRLDRAVFHGVFDRVERTPEGWRVVDYKIGRQNDAYSDQIAFYVWALRNITGADSVTGHVCYLRPNETIVKPVDVSTDEVTAHAAALEASFSSGAYAASPGRPCDTCPYSAICCYYSG
jgi:superfamily I DNA/RNA helicase